MKIFTTISELQSYRKILNGDIGFVPTMGALHQGHISLIKQAIQENEHTIVSIFVNPTQFLAGEDFETYPKRIAADTKICELAGVDALFMPSVSEIYTPQEPLIKAPFAKSYILEGFNRAGHFDGVLLVVLKLLLLTDPTRAYFGKKDAQQLYLIQNMVAALYLHVSIIPCEIVRDEQGLALSSRNAYLSEIEKQEALAISKSLKIASKEIMQGNLHVDSIIAKMQEVMHAIQVQYIAITNRDFEVLQEIQIKNSIILVAAKVGQTRLIDNIWI
ncbi:MAG: pantoate--beta-alanine ligase [Sulfurospirillum sp.]|nr:pantoate--beta-alanine ligase [Sulfurospirillum sp.]